MKDLSRREFIHAVTGAAVGTTVAGHDSFLHGETLAALGPAAGQSSVPCDEACQTLESAIFPRPQEITASDSDFVLNSQVRVFVPLAASEQDLLLARMLVNELSDRFGLFLKIERVNNLSAGKRAIVMGSIENPLVRICCTEMKLLSSVEGLGPEGYVLFADNNKVLIAGKDDRGAFYGLQSLRQLLVKGEKEVRFRGAMIRDWPDKPFRGIYMFLPGRDHIVYFKRFVSDFMALYKFNTVILEMNACMRLESHPEMNYGWVEFARDTNYSCRNFPLGPFHGMEQNASHQDETDGGFLEKEEVADLARWIKRHHIELIPDVPSFTHSYYLLSKEHRELAAMPQNKWPDTYCPTNPKSYELVFEVFDEIIDLLKPKSVHIGHDELYVAAGASPQCQVQDLGELFGQDVNKIHHHLASRGVKTHLWADMMLQTARGYGLQKLTTPDGWTYDRPGGMTPEQVERLIPKDCLIYNWCWSWAGKTGNEEDSEKLLEKMGFEQVFGNFRPEIKNYETRKKLPNLLGGEASAWLAIDETGIGKDLMSDFLGCSNILWTGHVIQGKDLSARIQPMLPMIRNRLSGITLPSQTETSIVPVDISRRFNTAETIATLGVSMKEMASEIVRHKNIPFDLRRSNGMHAIIVGTQGKEVIDLPNAVTGIPVGESPTSLVFLHASAKPALNRRTYRLIWDQQDTADLLGWYEVVYEDGFVTTIPIRYGVNILEWNWDQRVSSEDLCYGADAVAVGDRVKDSVTFFAYEWINPRLGKVIQEIRLKGTTGFRGGNLAAFDNSQGPVIASNAVMLAALSLVKMRS